MSWVIDASAAVEVLLRTPLGEEVLRTVDRAPLLAPDLLDAEVLAVLRREVLRKSLAEARALEALEDLNDWDIRRLPNRSLAKNAWQWRARISAYDALYIAAAAAQGAALITADGPLARTPNLAVTIHNVRR